MAVLRDDISNSSIYSFGVSSRTNSHVALLAREPNVTLTAHRNRWSRGRLEGAHPLAATRHPYAAAGSEDNRDAGICGYRAIVALH